MPAIVIITQKVQTKYFFINLDIQTVHINQLLDQAYPNFNS